MGGREVIDEDGNARLSFQHAHQNLRQGSLERPDVTMVRLGWAFHDDLPSLPRISKSSRVDCAFCEALRSGIEESLFERSKYYSVRRGRISFTACLSIAKKGVEGLVIEGTFQDSSFRNRVIQIFFPVEADLSKMHHLSTHWNAQTYKRFEGCQTWLGASPARGESYLDSTNVRDIRQCLDRCSNTCHPSEEESYFLPTRLIDIGGAPTCVPRLVSSSDIRKPEKTKYAAVSYCWGSEQDANTHLKTEEASLEIRCSGIPFEKMSPVIKDAIALTKAAGLRYIWIDSICIIQDEPDDWLYESRQSDLIYRHAFITFCALNSHSCHESFLHRSPMVKVPFWSKIREDIKGHYYIRLRPVCDDWKDRSEYDIDRSLSRWVTRGWTFQEEAVCTRMLLFGGSKMHFKCGSYEWSEGEENPKQRSEATLHDKITKLEQGNISAKELLDIYDEWRLAMTLYSKRTTQDKDRLPAISGLARIMAAKIDDEYYAGLWGNDLLRGLCWLSFDGSASHGLKTHLQRIKQRKYIAPSW
ncbi:HET-domain-containing protein [Periconia macrospinosa]|uniref:HET-domain-containing protein n=1 Tax=Periconia macrospinosa TaxID=97972 RepID=A0A2V1D3F9_9PLEO|nr:HET-domain-containing protein [Periconia macrospinosa]